MGDLEQDLRYLGVFEKAGEIWRELGPDASVRYVRASYRLLSKVYHPDLHQTNPQAAQEGQRRLNSIKDILDQTSDQQLIHCLSRAALDTRPDNPRILVVEDEQGLGDNLLDLLTLEGYQVLCSPNGLRGLKDHLTFRPALVITDVVMPIMDGVEMVRHMRKRDPGLKAVFISAFFGTRAVRSGLADEIERMGYPMLPKPFKPSRLLSLVESMLA